MKDLTAKDRVGIALIAFSLLAVSATFLTLERLADRAQRMDRADRDPTVVGTSRATAILLDVSDPLSPEQAAGVDDRVRALEEFEIHRGELVSLCTVGRYVDTDVRRWFCARYPGRAANPVFETPRRIAARCDSLFSLPLERALKRALEPARSGRTALAASIRETAEFEEFVPVIPIRRLVVVSDLMENTNDLSFYRTDVRRELPPSPSWLREHRANLRGVVVEVLEVPRPGVSVAERSALRTFWREYFAACGASSVRFGELP